MSGVDAGGAVSLNALVDDLKELSAHGSQAVGSCAALLAALGIPSDVGAVQAWRAVEARLKAYATQLDSELRMAFIEGMGLRPGAPQGSVERLRVIAKRIDRVERTARRRVGEALDEMARLILTESVPHDMGSTAEYLLANCEMHADLRGKAPTIVLRRTIQALTPSVERFEDKINLPTLEPGESIRVTALEGCHVSVEDLGSSSFLITSRFTPPVPYNGDQTFVISIQLPRHEAMVPMVGLYPVSPTTKFKASVRFGSRRPASVERFEGAIPVGTFPPVTQTFNPAVRYHESTFTAPRIGLGYGIKWGWD